MDGQSTFASAVATPFGFLPEPVRWEYLYAVQQRDMRGLARLGAFDVRGTYLALKRTGRTTVVGAETLGRAPSNANLTGLLVECQRYIDEAHRRWSGIDTRDPRLIYLSDLQLRKTSQRVGPNAKMDLRPIKNEWIFETIHAWAHADARGPRDHPVMAGAWVLADEVLSLRGTPRHGLGKADMDAIVSAMRERWPLAATQRHYIWAISRLIEFGHSDETVNHLWRDVSARFAVESSRHRPSGKATPRFSDADEPFRFVPQPIVDWIMDHSDLIDRGDPYRTAEARAMIFIHERCGRRTGETVRLRDNCISYDSQGSPYLEWTHGKPPYSEGKRLPIHQETHDVIREWQAIKQEHGLKSQWLFPSPRYSKLDQPFQAGYLRDRLKDLIVLIQARAPYGGEVEGADGNLIRFDLSSVDAYSFRHAFAQRLADATDAEGRPTTSPDVLRDYMGHRDFKTTMAYYQVTAKRRKAALSALPARRLNLRGQIVDVDRERDGFGKVAVTLGHCSEPQNVAANGHFCALEHSCESCPFFLVDPLERDGMAAKRHHLRVKLERAEVIQSPVHILDHYRARIADCTTIIDGIDAYIDDLGPEEKANIRQVLERMAEDRRRATAPRTIDLRDLLKGARSR